jgi:hypothetical protein
MNKFDFAILVPVGCEHTAKGWYFPKRTDALTEFIVSIGGGNLKPYYFRSTADSLKK